MGSPQRKRQFKEKARRATLIIADIIRVFLIGFDISDSCGKIKNENGF
jgi:hypothetical protein